MTVAELVRALGAYDPDRVVVVSKDAEGNAYSPLAVVDGGMYVADSTWRGEVYEEEHEYGDEPDHPSGAVPCVVLGPTS